MTSDLTKHTWLADCPWFEYGKGLLAFSLRSTGMG